MNVIVRAGAEMEAAFGPAQEFQPTVTYIRDGDCIEFFARPGSYYAERLDDLVTVYLDRKSGEIVGSVIKGVSTFCKKSGLEDRGGRRPRSIGAPAPSPPLVRIRRNQLGASSRLSQAH